MYGPSSVVQGRITSNGSNILFNIPSGVDWIWIYNETILNDAALGADAGGVFYWQRGMTDGRGLEWQKLGTVANDPMTTVQIAADSGFFDLDTSVDPVGAAVAVTGITNVVGPVSSTANTGSLSTGSIVRLQGDSNVPNISGFDFEVDNVVANTSFAMRWDLATAPGAAGAGDGTYRHIKYNPMFYPRHRFIVNITQAASAVVRFSVAHGYTVGQEIRFKVPSEFGMVQMDNLVGTVTAVSTANNTATVDIDSSAFTAFAFPGAAAVPFTWAQATPVGEDTAEALSASVSIIGDATYNTGQRGVLAIGGGADNPGGQNGDVLYWVAGKSFSLDNQ